MSNKNQESIKKLPVFERDLMFVSSISDYCRDSCDDLSNDGFEGYVLEYEVADSSASEDLHTDDGSSDDVCANIESYLLLSLSPLETNWVVAIQFASKEWWEEQMNGDRFWFMDIL